MSQIQQLRLKASTRAVPSTMPTVDPTTPRPTATANPVSPPANHPTSSTIPMENDDTAAAGTGDNAADLTMRAESISSGKLFWNNLVTNECAPMVRYLLDDADFYPIGNMTAPDKLKAFATIGNIRSSERDGFIPAHY
eukprot:6492555-Amphidinium_carterae.6